ncbi:MAG: TonB-dependent receptor [Ignavibacteriales bacterium]|nr:TonB-dependent receptor [Ignavibacteriales bacterium]
MRLIRVLLLPARLGLILLMLGSFTFLQAQETNVRGVVTDAETGLPLPGTTVQLVGTTIGTTTSPEGNYSIRVPSGYNILQFSYVGYKMQRVSIEGRTVIDLALRPDALQLDAVVVMGYGTLSKRQVTGSVGQISRDDMGDFVPRTVDQALQGRISGVQLTNASGLLGSPSTIRIRGAASISASTAPLVIVDGVPITNPVTAGSSSIGQGAGGQGINPLINLDPNDIESYEVLKDASSAAIYGARGSNGVILITTRRGRPDQQIVNVRTYTGSLTETNRYDMMNGEEFTKIWNEAAVNRFGPTGGGLLLPTTNIVNTDWTDVVRQDGKVTETSASVTGGTQQTRYYIGGTYRSEDGFVRRNELERYSGRLSLDHSLNDQVRVGMNISPSRTDNFRVYTENAVASAFTYAALYYPNVAPRKADGSLNLSFAPNPIGVFPGTPLSNVEGIDFKSSLTQVLSTGTLDWNILTNLSFNTSLSVDLFQLTESFKRASYTTDGTPDGNAFSSSDQYVNYNINSTLQFADQMDDHRYSIVAGISAVRSDNISFSAFARNFPTDLLKTVSSAATPVTTGGAGTSFSFLGYLSRITYSYMDRYLLTLSGRIDGSSRFGADHRYGFFPAASAGWIVSDEGWFSEFGVIDFLKLRASMGQTGNSEIGNFPSLALVGSGFNYNDVPGIALSQLANPGLRWEKTTQIDGAVEFGILGNAVRGSVGYYSKKTSDLLLNVPVSRVNGFATLTQNIGEMENSGLELELSVDIFHSSDLRWTMSGNISTVNNKVTKLVPGQTEIIFANNIVREGEPLGAWYLVRYNGPNSANGNATWLDTIGNVAASYNLLNRVIAGSPFPDYFGGFTSSFAIGPIDATIFFQFTKGNMIYRGDGSFTDSNLNSVFNQARRQNDYWSSTNTGAANPQPRLLLANGSQASTRYLEDGSYLRLKTLTVGYTLPSGFLANMRARVYLQGTNLWTSSKYLGMDPEVANVGNINQSAVFFQLPQAKTLVFGIDLTL